MKLDPDLIRKILIAYEELPYGGGEDEIEITGYPPDQLHYHQEILEEAGYIKADIQKDIGGSLEIFPERLTYQGHDFLEASRNDNNWNKTKDIMAKTGGFVLDIAKAVLIEFIKNQTLP